MGSVVCCVLHWLLYCSSSASIVLFGCVVIIGWLHYYLVIIIIWLRSWLLRYFCVVAFLVASILFAVLVASMLF